MKTYFSKRLFSFCWNSMQATELKRKKIHTMNWHSLFENVTNCITSTVSFLGERFVFTTRSDVKAGTCLSEQRVMIFLCELFIMLSFLFAVAETETRIQSPHGNDCSSSLIVNWFARTFLNATFSGHRSSGINTYSFQGREQNYKSVYLATLVFERWIGLQELLHSKIKQAQ